MMKFYESAHSFVQSHAHIPVTMKYKIYQDLYQLTRAHPSLTSTPNPPPPPPPPPHPLSWFTLHCTYFWNSHSLLSKGHTCLVFNHREIQWKWNAC